MVCRWVDRPCRLVRRRVLRRQLGQPRADVSWATYDAAFIGVAPGNFLLGNTSSVFVLKVFSLIWPSGEQKTYNYGLPGFTDKPLLTCSYVDPQGLLNVFSGFITPRAI